MSILVVCPDCRKRFRVKEKFAGRSGHCPNCKYPITVPSKSSNLKLHTPEQFEQGGRDAADQLVLKPITRVEEKFNPVAAAVYASAGVVLFAVALAGGKIGLFQDNFLITAAALTLISPFLALTGYGFLYDEDLEPYKGKSLYIRSAICGLIYVLLWGVYFYVSDMVVTGEVWNWVFIAPPFFAAGALVAAATFDLEYGPGFFHYAFYLLVTILLRWAAGLDWIWNVG